MDIKRAAEIITMRDMVDVTCNGGRVYIEDVNVASDTATVHYLDEPNNSQEIAVSQLVEA